MIERGHVINLLEQTKNSVREEDTVKLKELSNQTIHSASTDQDPDSIAIAVILYSLSKIIERKKYYIKQAGWSSFFKKYTKAIDKAILDLKKSDEKAFHKDISSIRQAINDLSGKLKIYIKDVFNKAKINKASKIYEHGISMEKTANLLGINLWELANYAGQTEISDVNLNLTQNIKNRIKNAMEMFEK